jgi:ADP-heptose:LPS heptosyltransferase
MVGQRIITSLMRPFFRKGEDASFTLPLALGQNSRVLCLDTGDLSDFLFHLPLINAIKRHNPGCQIDYLVSEKHEKLVVPCRMGKQYIVYKERQLNPWRPAFGDLLRKLGQTDYDLALLMSIQPQPELELAVLSSGAPLRLGPAHKKSWPAVNFELHTADDGKNYLGDRWVAAAPFLGLKPEQLNPRWPLPMDKLRHMAQQVHFHKPNPDQMLIGMDPGVAKSGHAIAQDNLQFLARQLTGQFMARVLAVGNPGDAERRQEFEVRLADVPTGLPRDTLLDMLLLLSQCDLFIGGNTDFFHFAVANGVPALGLFSESEDEHWVPRGRPKVRVMRLKKGKKLEMEEFLQVIEEVTGGRTMNATRVLPPGEDDPAGGPGPGEVFPDLARDQGAIDPGANEPGTQDTDDTQA